MVYTFPSPFCRSHSSYFLVKSKQNSLTWNSFPRAFEIIILVSQDRNLRRGFPKARRFPTQISKQRHVKMRRKQNHKMIPASWKVEFVQSLRVTEKIKPLVILNLSSYILNMRQWTGEKLAAWRGDIFSVCKLWIHPWSG